MGLDVALGFLAAATFVGVGNPEEMPEIAPLTARASDGNP